MPIQNQFRHITFTKSHLAKDASATLVPNQHVSLKRLRAYFILILLSPGMLASCGLLQDDEWHKQAIKEANDIYSTAGYSGARHYIDSAYLNGGESNHSFQLFRYKLLAEWCYVLGKLDSSDQYVDSELNTITNWNLERKYNKLYSFVLNAKGDILFKKNDLTSAFEYYSRSKSVPIEKTDSCRYMAQYYSLGMITYRQKRYEEAANYFKTSLRITGFCGYDRYRYYKQEELLMDVGLSYVKLLKYDSAAIYFSKALNLVATGTSNFPDDLQVAEFYRVATGVLKGNLAKVYISQGRLDTAVKLLQESIALNDTAGFDVKDAIYSRIQLAEIYYGKNNYAAAYAELQLLQQRFEQINPMDVRLRALRLLCRYHNKMKNQVEAATVFEQYLSLKDSIQQVETSLRETDYAQLIKDKDAEYKISLLTRDAELNRVYLGLFIALSSLAIVMILAVYRNYRRSRKNVRTLTLLNEQIKAQRDALEYTMSQLKASNTAKDRILHVVAHDLRNPVSGIVTLNDMIAFGSSQERQTELVKLSRNAAVNALALINEILEYSEDSTPHLTIDISDLNELIQQSVSLLQLKADSKKQTINYTPKDYPVYIRADSGKINRLLGNLLANAIKFSPRNSAIDVMLTESEKIVRMVVTDHGVGIPESMRGKVFTLFTDAKRTGTDGEPSFGMGLAICQQIVEAHSGRIWVESVEGEGSSFFAELPVRIQPPFADSAS